MIQIFFNSIEQNILITLIILDPFNCLHGRGGGGGGGGGGGDKTL